MKKVLKVVETIKQEEEIEILCDICGVPEGDWKMREPEFEGYQDEVVTIKHAYSENSYDYYSSNTLDLDVCPRCFEEKILPYIRSIAVLPIEYRFWNR